MLVLRIGVARADPGPVAGPLEPVDRRGRGSSDGHPAPWTSSTIAAASSAAKRGSASSAHSAPSMSILTRSAPSSIGEGVDRLDLDRLVSPGFAARERDERPAAKPHRSGLGGSVGAGRSFHLAPRPVGLDHRSCRFGIRGIGLEPGHLAAGDSGRARAARKARCWRRGRRPILGAARPSARAASGGGSYAASRPKHSASTCGSSLSCRIRRAAAVARIAYSCDAGGAPQLPDREEDARPHPQREQQRRYESSSRPLPLLRLQRRFERLADLARRR